MSTAKSATVVESLFFVIVVFLLVRKQTIALATGAVGEMAMLRQQ